MKITALEEADIPSLFELVQASEQLSESRITLYWLFSYFFHQTSFVAKEGDKVIGVILGFMDQMTGELGYIHKLGVLKEYRNQGVATALVDFFAEAARELGAKKIALTTVKENKNAVQFYENRGFTERKEITKAGEERIWFARPV